MDWKLEDKFRWLYNRLGRCTIFILCGYKTDFEDDLKKLEIVKKIGHGGYVMRYEDVYTDKKYIQLARWANQHHIFHTHTFLDFLEKSKSGGQRVTWPKNP